MQYKYSYKFTQRTPGALTVCNTGVQRCEGGYSWGPGVRDHYLIHYVISGQGVYEEGGQRHALQAGDLFLVRPDQSIYYQADERSPWEYCWVGFHGAEAGLLLEQTGLKSGASVLRKVGEEIRGYMMQIYNARGSSPHQTAFMRGTLYQLMSALMRESDSAQRRRKSECVERGCEFIENNFALPITIEDVADHVGLSRSRMYRWFVAELNQTPMQVLTQVRIQQACALLRRGNLSIKEVAASVGFDNQLYFSRRFHEIMGMPPSRYAADAENT